MATRQFCKNYFPKWRVELRKAQEEVIIVSPYITAKVEALFPKDFTGRKLRVYTSFHAHLFASGASSLDALEQLLLVGASLFHLRDLHAKIVLIPDQFASIGSQNLTKCGQDRKEATAELSKRSVKHLQTEIQEWMENASPITLDMINHMKRFVGPLRRKHFLRFLKEADKLDKNVRESEAERRELLQQEARARRRSFFEKCHERTRCYLEKQPRSKTIAVQVYRDWTLPQVRCKDMSLSLTNNWRIGRKEINLYRSKRYLIFNCSKNWYGYARVFKTRISFLSSGFIRSGFEILNRIFDIEVGFKWGQPDSEDSNLEIVFKHSAGVPAGEAMLSCAFSLGKPSFSRPTIKAIPESSGASVKLADWLKARLPSVLHECFQEIVSPFHYAAGYKFDGRGEVSDFFPQSLPGRYILYLRQLNNNEVLVAEIV